MKKCEIISLLKRFAQGSKPEFVRGDIAWGTDNVMREMEEMDQRYLFKFKKSINVKELIYKNHCLGEWGYSKAQKSITRLVSFFNELKPGLIS